MTMLSPINSVIVIGVSLCFLTTTASVCHNFRRSIIDKHFVIIGLHLFFFSFINIFPRNNRNVYYWAFYFLSTFFILLFGIQSLAHFLYYRVSSYYDECIVFSRIADSKFNGTVLSFLTRTLKCCEVPTLPITGKTYSETYSKIMCDATTIAGCHAYIKILFKIVTFPLLTFLSIHLLLLILSCLW
ncbi:hypothetical protein HZS_6998 [Henneguya salminicola]|nr:hypothetical protein HZS_6998 [Henneguya salminicola]